MDVPRRAQVRNFSNSSTKGSGVWVREGGRARGLCRGGGVGGLGLGVCVCVWGGVHVCLCVW
jgi:hypothetical protein